MGRRRTGTVAADRGKLVLLLCGAALVASCLIGCDDDEKELLRLRALNNHAKHVALNIDCVACHVGARDQVYAELPSIDKCALCHTLDPNRKKPPYPPTPDELAKYIKSGEEIPWIRVNRLAGHVYFSHAAHVKYGNITCAECHGDMKDLKQPVQRPLVYPPNMIACMDCHRKHNASVDCLTCHK